MFWLLTLPLKLAFAIVFGLLALLAFPFAALLVPILLLVWLPLMLVKFALRLAFAVVLLPIVAIVTLLGLAAGGVALVAALLVPLLPLALIVFCGWALWRAISGHRFGLPA
jgi:hypothetical protein